MSDNVPRATPRELVKGRLELTRLVPQAGALLTSVTALVNLVVGVLPVAFVIATSVVLGKAPAAVRGGLDSGAACCPVRDVARRARAAPD